jgi:hypothetical protein
MYEEKIITNRMKLDDITEKETRDLVCVYIQLQKIPVAARCNAWVCGCSLAETVGSNAAGGINVCLSRVLRVVG